ncbi:MAG: acetyltransferase [Pseudoalteromonas sp.]|nr:acetyltransferase [Pseudoalteromonas sp.]
MSKSGYLIIGAGGHAAALAEILIKQKKTLLGVVAPDILAGHAIFDSVNHYTQDDDVLRFSVDKVLLVNGIGAMPRQTLRKKIFTRFSKLGYTFATVIADSALVSDYAVLAEGVQIMNRVVINIGCEIGENTIINTSVSVDHDCIIGAHSHLAPGTTLSGEVKVENSVHIATGVSVINNVTIGTNSIIDVGANVTKSVNAKSIVYGARSTIKGLVKNDN